MTETVARLSGVTRRYGKQMAVDGLDLAIPRGGIYGLLGPNGAGKTTTVSLLLGLTRPHSGTVRVLGLHPGAMAVRRAIGAMLQISGVPATLTVREHVEQFSGYYERPLPFTETIRHAGLEGLENRRFGRLSSGQRQRVLFALAICGDPKLLFLDEPTVGLDVEARRRMWAVIRDLAREGRTILLTTHYLEEADALADRVGVLNHGRLVVEGTPDEIKRRVGGCVIHCESTLADSDLRGLPGVRAVRRDGARLELTVDRAETVVRAMLARDTRLSGLEVRDVGLEDAFLSLTGSEEEAA